MWRQKLLELGYRLSNTLEKHGVKGLGPLPYLRRKMRRALEKEPLLVKIAGQSLYLHNGPCCWEMIPKSVDPFAVEIFKSAIRASATVLDIGAHVGVYALIASNLAGHDGKVYAFEPASENFSLLLRNVNSFGRGNIVSEQKAIAEGKGSAPFYIWDRSWAMNALKPHPGTSDHRVVSVECTSVDEYLSSRPVDVIKMDIEGYEPYALTGMQQTISASKSLVLLVELNPLCLSASGVDARDFIARLEDFGFHVTLIDEGSRALRTITESILRSIQKSPGWVGNLYCVKKRHFVTV